MLNPGADEGDECGLLNLEVRSASEHDHRAISSEPLEHARWVFNLQATWFNVSFFCPEVKDDPNAFFLPEVRGGKVLVGSKAWRVPLHTFLDVQIST